MRVKPVKAPAPSGTTESDTISRVVRGPGRYLGVKAGGIVEVPRAWLFPKNGEAVEPTVEQCSMSVEEAQAARRKKPGAASPVVQKAKGALRAAIERIAPAAAARMAALKEERAATRE